MATARSVSPYSTVLWARRCVVATPDAHCEILIFVYTPVPQPGALFEDATRAGFRFPSTLEEWAEPRWVRFMSMKDPQTPWLSPRLRRRIMDLELVVKSRFPTATDIRFTRPARWLLQGLASWRWAAGVIGRPWELAAVHRLVKLRSPELQGFDAPPARRHRPPLRMSVPCPPDGAAEGLS